jgi:hypothetical protein
VRFEKGQVPPAEAFCSLTLYDTGFFFVRNAINRYDLGKRNRFVADAGGSVGICFQANLPGQEKVPIWLPALKGRGDAVGQTMTDPNGTGFNAAAIAASDDRFEPAARTVGNTT